MEMFWAIVVVQALFSGILASIVAGKKGHPEGAWFATGFFLGVFGLIAAAGLPDLYARPGPYAPELEASRTCPDCAEPIRAEARVCKYCGHAFRDEDLIADAVRALASEDEGAMVDAVRVLCNLGGQSVVPYLVDVLDGCPEEVCAEVAGKLKDLGASSAVPALTSALVGAFNHAGGTRGEEELVAAFSDSLAELADASIGASLAPLLDLEATLVSKVCLIELLGALQATDQIPILLRSAGSNNILRPHALDGVRAMGKGAVPVLERALSMPGRRQKKMIQSLLDELAGSSGADSREPN